MKMMKESPSHLISTNMLNDKQLEVLSYEVDDILMTLAQKHNIGSLSLSSIMIARLMRLVMETGDLDDLRSIMVLAINTTDDRTRDTHTIQ